MRFSVAVSALAALWATTAVASAQCFDVGDVVKVGDRTAVIADVRCNANEIFIFAGTDIYAQYTLEFEDGTTESTDSIDTPVVFVSSGWKSD